MRSWRIPAGAALVAGAMTLATACREPDRPTGVATGARAGGGGAAPRMAIVAAPAQADSAARLYQAGREALDRGDSTIALRHFDEAMRWPLAVTAPQVMYWKAFMLDRRGESADLVVARNLLQLALQLASRAQHTGDASMLLLRVQSRLAQRGDASALRDLDVPLAQAARCGEASSARLAWAVDPRLGSTGRAARLGTLITERVPCGALLREQAVLLLARTPEPSAIATLLRVAELDPAIGVRRAALRALPSPAPDAAKPVLRRVLEESQDVGSLEFAAAAWHSRRADWGTALLEEFLARPGRNATASGYVRTLLGQH